MVYLKFPECIYPLEMTKLQWVIEWARGRKLKDYEFSLKLTKRQYKHVTVEKIHYNINNNIFIIERKFENKVWYIVLIGLEYTETFINHLKISQAKKFYGQYMRYLNSSPYEKEDEKEEYHLNKLIESRMLD